MMLQIDHRESRDRYIFLQDAQLLPFLDPQKKDFRFGLKLSECVGDGVRHLKFAFDGVGEIDFIVASALTPTPTILKEIEGVSVQVETLPEIITKKVVYRGAHIMPRDVFDLAAAGEGDRVSITTALRSFRSETAVALRAVRSLNPEFAASAIANLSIQERYRSVAQTALPTAVEILEEVTR